MTEGRANYYTNNILAGLPAGLEPAILRILSFHKGAETAITKEKIIDDLAQMGHKHIGERQVRQMISDLRKRNVLIGSSAGKEPGYYMITTWAELDTFIQEELDSRIKDLNESKQALIHAAAAQLGPRMGNQERLF